MILVPKYFFTPDILKIRRALSPRSRRPGHIDSTIMYGDIPTQGKIAVIDSSVEVDKATVMKEYKQAVKLRVDDITTRSWLMDVL